MLAVSESCGLILHSVVCTVSVIGTVLWFWIAGGGVSCDYPMYSMYFDCPPISTSLCEHYEHVLSVVDNSAKAAFIDFQ